MNNYDPHLPMTLDSNYKLVDYPRSGRHPRLAEMQLMPYQRLNLGEKALIPPLPPRGPKR